MIFNKKLCSFGIIILLMILTMQGSFAHVTPDGADIGNEIQLYIFSCSSGTSSSLDTSGHSFLMIRNVTNSSKTVGVRTVAPGGLITIGTWGNKNTHRGIWYDLESYFNSLDSTSWDGRVSLKMVITSGQLGTINSYIATNDTWALTNNCSSFASRVWNSISTEKVNAGLINTPTNLKNSIMSKLVYENNATLPIIPTTGVNTKVGYKVNSAFFAPSFSNIN